jgi:hypothetical protein
MDDYGSTSGTVYATILFLVLGIAIDWYTAASNIQQMTSIQNAKLVIWIIFSIFYALILNQTPMMNNVGAGSQSMFYAAVAISVFSFQYYVSTLSLFDKKVAIIKKSGSTTTDQATDIADKKPVLTTKWLINMLQYISCFALIWVVYLAIQPDMTASAVTEFPHKLLVGALVSIDVSLAAILCIYRTKRNIAAITGG